MLFLSIKLICYFFRYNGHHVKFLKLSITFKQGLAFLLLPTAFLATASDINVADKFFEQEKYAQAIAEYRLVAQEGNVRAYYQLGGMNYLGFGTEKNIKQALVWYSLAAKHYHGNAKDIVDNLRGELAKEQQAEIDHLVTDFQQKFSIENDKSAFLPVIDKTDLTTKVNFIDNDDPSVLHENLDKQVLDAIDFSFESDVMEFSEEDGGFGGDAFMDELSDPTKDKPYFLVVDAEVAPDGSLRDFSSVQTMGDTKKAMESLPGNKLLQPIFKSENVAFVHRSHLGLASYDVFKMKNEYPSLKVKIKRMISPLKDNDLPKAQYQYAMVLMSFTWLKREEGEVEQLLKNAADAGYALAQYEYGLKLYREQKDPQQAFYWLTKASEQGLAQAEYRLGRFLLDSPWLENDEAKALYWLESAANKKHLTATRKVAEIKLLAENKQLRDIEGAISYLAKLEDEQRNNPEYHFLRAIAYNSAEPRDRAAAVSTLRKAIFMGSDYNWDVSDWQERLTKWTTGSVTVTDL